MRPYVLFPLVCIAVFGVEFSQPSAHARIFRFRRCRAVETTCPPVKEKIRVEPASGGRFEMPDDAADWFRATLKNSKVKDVRDNDGPLWDITPALPGVAFREGERTYELYLHLHFLIEKHRGKTVRFHDHDAWGRLEYFCYNGTGKGGKTLIQYLQDEAKAGQRNTLRVEIVGGEDIELPEDVGVWFRATLKQSKISYPNSKLPSPPDSLPALIFNDGQSTIELHYKDLMVAVSTESGRWGREYRHDAFGKMYNRYVEIDREVKWDQDDRKAIVTKLWLEYFQNEAKSLPESQDRSR